MVRVTLFSFISLALLSGCTNEAYQYSNNLKSEESIINDGAVGYTVLSTTQNNQKFEIMFCLPTEEIINAENFLCVNVNYDGFPEPQVNESVQLKFEMFSENGEKEEIILQSEKISAENLKKLNNYKKESGIKILELREFIISKKDFKKLSHAKFINYQMKMDGDIVRGDFPKASILDLRKYSKKLLDGKAYKPLDITEIKKELENLFVDFEILKAGASKKELEEYFKVKFKNDVKDPYTGAYEEVISPIVGGQELGPMIVGFDEAGKLVYVRDFFNKAKINWLKDKKAK